MAGPFTVAELARHLGGEVEGDPARLIEDVRGLDEAGPTHLGFVANRRYVRRLPESAAGADLLDPDTPAHGHTVIRLADPYAAFARALGLFHPASWPAPGIDPRSAVDPTAEVEGATIEAFAFIGANAVVGPGAWIQAGAYVGAGARVGAGSRLMPQSVVTEGCVVGARVWLNPGAVVGAEGFGFAPTRQGLVKIPQIGRAVIEDDVEIGANSAVDRAAMGDTVVRRGAKLDNLVQVGHGAEVGPDCIMVAYSGVAGSAKLGRGVALAARGTVLGHLEIGDGVSVGVGGVVHDDQPAGAKVSGLPAIPHRQWLRASTAFSELPELLHKVRRLEARVAELEAKEEEPHPTTVPPRVGPCVYDIRQVLQILPHRTPFVMIDRVIEVDPGQRAVGVKCVAVNEPWFQGHFPEQPIMPGVLLAEAFAQLAGIIALSANPDHAGQAVYLIGLDGVRFRRPVTPGDRVILTCEKSWQRRGVWKFRAQAEVDGIRVADGEIMATVTAPPSIAGQAEPT